LTSAFVETIALLLSEEVLISTAGFGITSFCPICRLWSLSLFAFFRSLVLTPYLCAISPRVSPFLTTYPLLLDIVWEGFSFFGETVIFSLDSKAVA
jgi:hypothetical protein